MEKKYQKELNLNGNIFEYDKSKKDYIHRLADDRWVSETILFKVMCNHFIEEIMNIEVEILEDNTEEIEEIEEIGAFCDLIGMSANEEVLYKMIRCVANKTDELVAVINKIKENKEEK